MINVSIEGGVMSFTSSVLGSISEVLVSAEVVDKMRLHLISERHVHLINVQQYSFNGNVFATADEAVDYIQTLNN